MICKNNEALERYADLNFPNVYTVVASAGSGKTYTLTLRLLQFLLSCGSRENKKRNRPAEILAVTFTNNSAKEMKAQVLERLKSLSLDILDKEVFECIKGISNLCIDPDINKSDSDSVDKYNDKHEYYDISSAAGDLIDEILLNYHDFQIITIDSFTSKIIKASASEIMLPPDFEISTESSVITDYAVLNMIESAEPKYLDAFLDLLSRNISKDGVNFNPVERIKEKMNQFIEIESNYNSEFLICNDLQTELDNDKTLQSAVEGLKSLLRAADENAYELRKIVKQDTVDKIKKHLDSKNYYGLLIDRKQFPYIQQNGEKDSWEDYYGVLNDYVVEISKLQVLPYLTLYNSFKENLINAYKLLGLVYISDINKKLSSFLNKNEFIVPEVYFKLGSSISHYFIDEFQDTSKVQWQNLKPLIEEALSTNGSLFTVGDLKQSLYGFRGADYKIMKSLKDKPVQYFPSCGDGGQFKNIELKYNFRSDKCLVDYVREVCQNSLREKIEKLGDPAGFLTYKQDTPLDDDANHINPDGFVSTEIFHYETKSSAKKKADGKKDAKTENGDSKKEASSKKTGLELQYIKNAAPSNIYDSESDPSESDPLDLIEVRLVEIIKDLSKRNYALGDIAILAQKNKYLNDLAERLSSEGFNVVTQSSLDIRKRKIVKEIEMLLNFLSSPIDDFNFGGFIISEIFNEKIKPVYSAGYQNHEFVKFLFETNLYKNNKNQKTEGNFKKEPLYVIFKKRYEDIWNECFEDLFNKVGYLPPYEIVLNIYEIFDITKNFPDDSAYLAHFLDVVQAAEKNSADLNGLLELMSDSDSGNGGSSSANELFYIELPEIKDAVNLFTVHKAKGLQWDVVINVFISEDNYALMPEKEDGNITSSGLRENYFAAESNDEKGLDLLYISKSMFESKNRSKNKDDAYATAESAKYLESVYTNALKEQNISDLNNFYVALTRAKHEMYNLILENKGCFLAEEKKTGEKTCKKENKLNIGDKSFAENLTVAEDNDINNLPIVLDCGYCDIQNEYGIKSGSQYLSIRRGDLFHKILSEIKYSEDFNVLDKLLEKSLRLLKIKLSNDETMELKQKIEKIKDNSSLLKLFDKNLCEVHTEKEYLCSDGLIYRIDRVSVFKDLDKPEDDNGLRELKKLFGDICIIDYKTGDVNKKELENYKLQLDNYKSILKDIYKDKEISAFIYKIDGGELLSI